MNPYNYPSKVMAMQACDTGEKIEGFPNDGISNAGGTSIKWIGYTIAMGGTYQLCWCSAVTTDRALASSAGERGRQVR